MDNAIETHRAAFPAVFEKTSKPDVDSKGADHIIQSKTTSQPITAWLEADAHDQMGQVRHPRNHVKRYNVFH